jgi:hypothetical protein
LGCSAADHSSRGRSLFSAGAVWSQYAASLWRGQKGISETATRNHQEIELLALPTSRFPNPFSEIEKPFLTPLRCSRRSTEDAHRITIPLAIAIKGVDGAGSVHYVRTHLADLIPFEQVQAISTINKFKVFDQFFVGAVPKVIHIKQPDTLRILSLNQPGVRFSVDFSSGFGYWTTFQKRRLTFSHDSQRPIIGSV